MKAICDRELSDQARQDKDIERYQTYQVHENFEMNRALVTQSVLERHEY